MFKLIFILVCGACPFDLMATSHPLVGQLSESPFWRRIMHYERSATGHRWVSRVDGDSYFFSPQGKFNPYLEIQASIDAFRSNDSKIGRLGQSPQCAFPLRFEFLNKSLNLGIRKVNCPLLEQYQKDLDAAGVSLVFSSAYASNPGSMFGHTFFRIRKHGAKSELLDTGVSYAASVSPDENGAAFVWFGLTGGYKGMFSMLPYYRKVNEYNDGESRDLWEYELNLNEAEVRNLVLHLWELETTTYFDYYFLDENCSYLLLTILEVAKPDWNLSERGLYVVPAETIKTLSRIPDAIRDVHFRPSLARRMKDRYDVLSLTEKKEIIGIMSGRQKLDDLVNRKSIDALSSALFYKKARNGGKLDSQGEALFLKVLQKRAKLHLNDSDVVDLNVGSEKAKMLRSRPDLGHGPIRFDLGSGFNYRLKSYSPFIELGFKFAYHDLLDNDQGYIPFSEIDWPWAKIRLDPSNANLNWDELGLMKVVSLSPANAMDFRFSWQLVLEGYSPKDLSCESCHAFHFVPAGGLSLGLSSTTLTYFLAGMNIETLSFVQNHFRFGPGIDIGFISNPFWIYKLQAFYRLQSDLLQNYRRKYFSQIVVNQSLQLSKRVAGRLSFSSLFSDRSMLSEFYEMQAQVLVYF